LQLPLLNSQANKLRNCLPVSDISSHQGKKIRVDDLFATCHF